MENKEKIIKLYGMYISKQEKDDLSIYTEKYFRDCLEFFKKYENMDEASLDFQKSSLYMEGSQAYFLDSLNLKAKAANYMQREKIEVLYFDRMAEIKENPNVIMDVENVAMVNNMILEGNNEYERIEENLVKIFVLYFQYSISPEPKILMDIQRSLTELETGENNFESLARKTTYRKFFPCSENIFEKFIEDINEFKLRKTFSGIYFKSELVGDMEKEITDYESIVDKKLDFINKELKKYSRKSVLMQSPLHIDGNHKSVMEKEEEI